jgi:hypothetical protein
MITKTQLKNFGLFLLLALGLWGICFWIDQSRPQCLATEKYTEEVGAFDDFSMISTHTITKYHCTTWSDGKEHPDE